MARSRGLAEAAAGAGLPARHAAAGAAAGVPARASGWESGRFSGGDGRMGGGTSEAIHVMRGIAEIRIFRVQAERAPAGECVLAESRVVLGLF